MCYRLGCVLALVGLVAVALGSPCRAGEPAKPLRAGIIGLDTSHVIAFTRLLNDPNAEGDLADVQVVAGFPGGSPDIPASADRVDKYTEQLRSMGIEICDSIPELLEKVDVVLLESVDGRPHLEQVRPVFAAGKPVFIDKPLAGSLADALQIAMLAKKHKVPFFSSSSTRFSSGFQAIRNGTAPFGQIKSCVARSPMSIEPHHPDLFWYGIHGVEILFTIMGPGCEKVTRVEQNKVVGVWKDGREGTFLGEKGYGATVEGTKQSGEAGKYEGYQGLVKEIARFFKTGKPPVSVEETLEIYAFMEAADESKRQGGKPVSIESVIEKAMRSKMPEEKQIDTQLPPPADSAPPTAKDQTVVEIRQDGRISLDGAEVTLQELGKRLDAARSKSPDVSIHVRADAKVQFQRVVEVLTLCQHARIQKLSFSRRPNEKE